jgi:hypothetical protein
MVFYWFKGQISKSSIFSHFFVMICILTTNLLFISYVLCFPSSLAIKGLSISCACSYFQVMVVSIKDFLIYFD